MQERQTIVSQSLEIWLPLTANWIYNHIRNMDQVHSIILARRLIAADRFPWRPLYAPGLIGEYRYKISKKTGYRWYPSIYDKAVQKHQPNVLHSHFGDIGWYDLPLVNKYSLSHVVTFYGFDVKRLPTRVPIWRSRYHELFAHADLFLCEGPYMAQSLVELGCPQEKVKVQRLGVELDQIKYVPRKLEKGDSFRVLIAGSFREKKGIPYALEAIGLLRNKGVDVQVTVIGDSRGLKPEEIEKQKIHDVLERHELYPVTHMLGYQPHAKMMAEAYKHHVFISPSVTASDGDTEGGAPITIIEMAASGMPIVSSRHCDIPQVVLDGRTGWLADERDVGGLVDHLHWLYENPQEWRAVTDEGRRHIETNFDVRIQARMLEKIYQQLASTK